MDAMVVFGSKFLSIFLDIMMTVFVFGMSLMFVRAVMLVTLCIPFNKLHTTFRTLARLFRNYILMHGAVIDLIHSFTPALRNTYATLYLLTTRE